MSIGIWIFIIFFIYFGTAPIISHFVYKSLKFSKLPQKKRYIGFWVRFGAGVADTFILVIVGFVLGFLIQIILYDTNFGPGSDYILGIVISWSYFCLSHSSKHQATIGMKMCKIKICDQNFKKITLGRATLRYFSAPLSGIIFLIGFLMIGFTKKKQGLHDLITKTLHINK
jgi:uncharacterized RDD family membrane protein YckC